MSTTSSADFTSPVELPFNRASLDADFRLAPPDQDPGGAGVWLLLRGTTVLTVEAEQEPQLPEGESPVGAGESSPLYIGQWQGKPCRLLSVPQGIELPPYLQKHPLRADKPEISVALLSLAGLGQMILHWEHTSRYCGNCGEPMIRLSGEWGKECVSCNNHHFPRIHPCVIGLVVRGDKILLARKAEWAEGRYSLVAGFVEFGECLEEAMAREVYEETNIRITNIRYLGSQSWPFPSQLMCGFVADYVEGEIELRDRELADAGWYRPDHLPTLPPKRSIARYIIDRAGEFI